MSKTIYRLKANELNEQFLARIKENFKDKEIEIVVYEADETEYLLSSEINKNKLLEAVNNINHQTNLV